MLAMLKIKPAISAIVVARLLCCLLVFIIVLLKKCHREMAYTP